MSEDPRVSAGTDPTVPSPARIYDYMLGGSYNFPADRAVAEQAMARVPELRDIVLANRGFHGRAARWIAGQGVRQFIDIGSGLPTARNTHEVVREIVPGARVAYIDIDPMVAATAAELIDDPESTAVLVADAREPDRLLADPALGAVIDFGEPAGLLITGVLHFIADSSDPWELMARYTAALAPDSYLALSHATNDNVPPASVQAGRDEYASASEQMHFRPRDQVARFFDGLELVPPYPGAAPELCYLGEWGAEDPVLADSDGSRWGYCAVGRRR
ncbi:MAG TPA: SAM-dependent methyltransferase [Streptosporangiaceae bacterium]